MISFREPDDNSGLFIPRLLIAGIAVLVGGITLVAKLYALQIRDYDKYHTAAEDNRIKLVPVVPRRGEIHDRNGVVLATNSYDYTLEVTTTIPGDTRPKARPRAELDNTIDELAKFIAIDKKDRERFHKFRAENARLTSAPIRGALTDEEIARFVGQRYRFSDVDVQMRMTRSYPFGQLASHLIGYINRISKSDAEILEQRGDADNYHGTEHIGKEGVEAQYETALHGITGEDRVEITAGGNPVRLLEHSPATPGQDIVLSIDIELQKVAEAAFGERRGAMVAVDPRNGEVLALVSVPTFDPNLFVNGITSENWAKLQEVGVPKDEQNKPLLNRALFSAYPPGSTFKPFMALAGLTHEKRTWTQKISDPGFFWFGGHQFMDDKKGGHGGVDMYKSLVVSCNTYYYMLAADLQIDRISSFMPQFGFGARTNIDLPGEAEGVLPSRAWKRKRYAKAGREQQKWYPGETISVGIGQGYNAYTPIQMAQAMATLANNGRRMQLHIAQKAIDSNNDVTEFPPELAREIDVKSEYIDLVRQALGDVTRFGTGTRAFAGTTYRAAGKTGTAQVYSLKGGKYDKSNERKRDHSWFIAYAPTELPNVLSDQPGIALAVLVENGGFGAVSAAPIARQVIDYWLLRKRADEPASEDANASDIDNEDTAHDRPAPPPQAQDGTPENPARTPQGTAE